MEKDYILSILSISVYQDIVPLKGVVETKHACTHQCILTHTLLSLAFVVQVEPPQFGNLGT